jgi:hypothetical protein
LRNACTSWPLGNLYFTCRKIHNQYSLLLFGIFLGRTTCQGVILTLAISRRDVSAFSSPELSTNIRPPSPWESSFHCLASKRVKAPDQDPQLSGLYSGRRRCADLSSAQLSPALRHVLSKSPPRHNRTSLWPQPALLRNRFANPALSNDPNLTYPEKRRVLADQPLCPGESKVCTIVIRWLRPESCSDMGIPT